MKEYPVKAQGFTIFLNKKKHFFVQLKVRNVENSFPKAIVKSRICFRVIANLNYGQLSSVVDLTTKLTDY